MTGDPLAKSPGGRKAPRTSVGKTRSPEAHAAIVQATRDILREEGYRGFSIEAVARRARAGKPTIYRWWKNPMLLLMEVYFKDSFENSSVEDRGGLEAECVAYIERWWAFWRNTPAGDVLRALIAEAQRTQELRGDLWQAIASKPRVVLRDIVERARARGELAPNVDFSLAFDAIYGMNWYRLLTGRIEAADAADAGKFVCGILRQASSSQSPRTR